MSKISLFSLSLAMGLFAFSALASEPSVQTTSIGSISGSCAMLQGYANTNNTSGYSRWFEVKELNKNMKPVTVGQSWSWFSYGSGNGNVGNYQSEAKYLNPDTDYVYRAVAQNSEGISYGQEISFRTKPAEYVSDSFNGCSEYIPMTTNRDIIVNVDTGAIIPASSSLNHGSQMVNYAISAPSYTSTVSGASYQIVTSAYAINVGSDSATLTAYVYPTQNITENGKFLWGKSYDTLVNSTSRVVLGSGAALTLRQQIYGLTPGTTYYYKPVIDNQFGSSEGSVLSFTTLGSAPLSAGQAGWTDNDSDYIAYNSTPIPGHIITTKTSNLITQGNSSNKTPNNTILTNTNPNQKDNTNVAAAAFSGKSYSIFPRTLTDWFTVISLLFFFALAYVSWKFYEQKKEDELEYSTIPETLSFVDIVDIPKKPIIKEESFSFAVNSVKSAPPDNLPV